MMRNPTSRSEYIHAAENGVSGGWLRVRAGTWVAGTSSVLGFRGLPPGELQETTDAVMMVCNDFIDRHTDYRDGLLSDEENARFDKHLEDCDSCQRYERVLSRGLTLWRGLSVASTSPDFMPRLQHRLYHVDDSGRLTARQHLGSAALVAVASVGLLAVTWMPFAARTSIEVELPAVAVEAPMDLIANRQPSLFEPGPYVASPFLTPLTATLDEPAGLFAANYVTVRGESTFRPDIPRSGQLDESR